VGLEKKIFLRRPVRRPVSGVGDQWFGEKPGQKTGRASNTAARNANEAVREF
jgi:hypothetical protein